MDPSALTRYSGNVEGLAVYMTVWMALAAVGAVPIGHTRKGTPIYPMAGGDGTGDLNARLDTLIGELRRVSDTRTEANPVAKAADGGRYANALDGSAEIAAKLTEAENALAAIKAKDADAARKAEIQEAVREAMHASRTPSIAAALGAGGGAGGSAATRF